MRLIWLCSLSLIPFVMSWLQPQTRSAEPKVSAPGYTADGRMLPPLNYREWVYLTSGLDMSYTPGMMAMGGRSVFDNVFVNPEAYRSFKERGTWPDKTMLVLEQRGAESKGSINQSGHFQGQGLTGLEVHVKDEAHGGWAFYSFGGDAPAKMVPKEADCYTCHREHAAVDTTFVQFYPTLLPLAKSKGTLSAAFLKDEARAAK